MAIQGTLIWVGTVDGSVDVGRFNSSHDVMGISYKV